MRVIFTFDQTNSELVLGTATGSVSLPTFSAGSSGGSVSEAIRIDISGSTRFVPFADPSDAQIDGIRLDGGSAGVKAVHDSATVATQTQITRPTDDTANNVTGASGFVFNPNRQLSGLKAEISQNTSGATTALIEEVSTGSVLGTTSISGLSSGDTFSISNVTLDAGTRHMLLLDAGGNTYTQGFFAGTVGYPLTGAAFDLTEPAFSGSPQGGNNSNGIAFNNVRTLNF
jgi:hypothetical protein